MLEVLRWNIQNQEVLLSWNGYWLTGLCVRTPIWCIYMKARVRRMWLISQTVRIKSTTKLVDLLHQWLSPWRILFKEECCKTNMFGSWHVGVDCASVKLSFCQICYYLKDRSRRINVFLKKKDGIKSNWWISVAIFEE